MLTLILLWINMCIFPATVNSLNDLKAIEIGNPLNQQETRNAI
jgi:hypothetical protein